MATVTRAKRATKDPETDAKRFAKCKSCGQPIDEPARWPTFGGSGLCPECDVKVTAFFARPANGDAPREASPLSTATPAGIAALDPEASPLNREEAPVLPSAGPTEPHRFTTSLASLGRNRFNPREHFDEAELDKLAESLRRHGQLQPVLVRVTEPGSPVKPLIQTETGHTRATHEIVAGERRVLAALKLGWTRITVEEVACDDARACELAIAENRDRKDISQVEYARGLQTLADLKGLDPAALAADQGLSEQHVRNLLRLLKTPREWQELVIEGKIDGTHLRTAAPFLHVPAIARSLAKGLAQDEEKPSLAEWSDMVRRAAWQHGGRIERFVYASGYRKSGTVEIKPTHPRWAELDVAEINGQQIALNAKLAKKLLNEEEAAWKKKQPAAAKGKQAKKPVDAAEKRRKAEDAKRQRAEKIKAIAVLWQSWLCSRRIADDPANVDLVLSAAAIGACCLPNVEDAVEFAFEKFTPKKRYGSLIGSLMALEPSFRYAFFSASAERLFWSDDLAEKVVRERWFYLDEYCDADVAAWLKRLSIDPREEFRRKGAAGQQEMLGPLTDAWLAVADVRALAQEWKVPVVDKDSDPEIRRKLTANAARIMPLPAELAAIVGGKAKAKARKPR